MSDITSNLAAWYKLDETSGTTATDSSGTGNTGTYARDASNTTASGRIGTAYSTNGSSDYVASSCSALNSLSAATISAWINRSATGTKNGFGANKSSISCFRIQWFSDNKIYCSVGNGTSEQLQTYTSTATGWHHICLVYDNAASPKLKLYFDGTSVTLVGVGITHTSLGSDAGNAFWTGRDVSNGYEAGTYDEVRAYSRALSSDDVSALYAYTGQVFNPLTGGINPLQGYITS